MCGRYVMARSTGELVAALDIEHVVGEDLRPSWNVAPTQNVRIVTGRGPDGAAPGRRLETARWGLVPVWAKSRSVGSRAINARSETVLDKPTFRSAAVKRRALVPADGYYEWSGKAGQKTATYLHGQDEEPLSFAGLYEFWRDPAVPEGGDGEWLMTTTILTRPATDALGHIHDRTPVIVPAEMRDDWLDPDQTDKAQIRQLIDAIPDPTLVPRRVRPAVGNVRNNGPDLIEPTEADE
ncbi:SOS response-associated peptidase [Citricoccus sp. GCM10030269]|uniref:SOS response-associated peptidase n=1 Tax=Citricoccus sp. GCM10030269 TaxID=3273388 RepID=UPI003619042A